MKKLFSLPVIISLAIFCSCQKQQTEEERKAEVERQVQERLAAERQAQSEQQLAQREADLEAREKALAAEKERVAESTPVAEALQTPLQSSRTDNSGNVATASYSTFYRKLDPYGVWRETPNYGYVWQPQEAERSRSWRPYTNGRWVYTDAGWTWISEEPFGWATYHYGRWTRLRNIGWVWVPGDEWAPAWVSWRKGNDYVGWAPLPPEAHFDRRSGIRNWADNYYDIGPEQYCFVPTNEFGARRLETAVVPVQRNVTIVNQTTNVTNISYSNTTIINQGPSYDDLRARSRQPIERLRLERQITANVEAETPRSVIRGDVVQIPAPVIATAQPAERPRKIKETVAQTVVERGWEGIADRQAAEKARAKIKSEATPPPDAPPKTLVRPTRATAETSPPFSRPRGKPTGAVAANSIGPVTQNSGSCRNGLTNRAIAPWQTSYNSQPGPGISSVSHSESDATITPNAWGASCNHCDALTASHPTFASTSTRNRHRDAASNAFPDTTSDPDRLFTLTSRDRSSDYSFDGEHEFKIEIVSASGRPFG
jgi:hypothetical protein